MNEKDNCTKSAELSTEQNCNMIDGIMNNMPNVTSLPVSTAKQLDKVKEATEKNRSQELER